MTESMNDHQAPPSLVAGDAIDAARYRFLRDKAWGKYGALALLPPDEMDAAVDAAMEGMSNANQTEPAKCT